MLGMNPIKGRDAAAAEYFGQSDGGYYLDGKELRREWGGKAARPGPDRQAGVRAIRAAPPWARPADRRAAHRHAGR